MREEGREREELHNEENINFYCHTELEHYTSVQEGMYMYGQVHVNCVHTMYIVYMYMYGYTNTSQSVWPAEQHKRDSCIVK